MPHTLSRILRIVLIALCWRLVLASSPALAAEPIEVMHSVSIQNSNWIPLSTEDMQRASVDTLLARLTDAGRLRILDSESGEGAGLKEGAPEVDRSARGELQIAIHLIAPAETAKVTITLDAPHSPTLVATAAISVRGLDYRGIYQAFEYIGAESADRLAAKLDHLAALPPSNSRSNTPAHADPQRRQAYADAQTAKRAGRYAEARLGFESIAASAEDAEDGLRLLAEDELRYGLPVYEALQAINQMAGISRPGQQEEHIQALSRAENLYRQIEAENQHDLARIAEAQRAIDGMLVMRRALGNAMRANLRSRAMSLRMEIIEFSMSEGQCPSESYVSDALSRRPGQLSLTRVVPNSGGGKRYRIEEPRSRFAIDLVCGPEGVDVVDAEGSLAEENH